MSSKDQSALREIDDLLTAMSSRADASLWTLEALRSAAEWNVIRTKARALLARHGQVDYRPQLSWLTTSPVPGPQLHTRLARPCDIGAIRL